MLYIDFSRLWLPEALSERKLLSMLFFNFLQVLMSLGEVFKFGFGRMYTFLSDST